MEIINTDSAISETVTRGNTQAFEEVFPEKPIDYWEINDREEDLFELIKTKVKEKSLVPLTEICDRLPIIPRKALYECLRNHWRAGQIRRFLKIRFGHSKAQKGKSQVWYVINNPSEYILPEINKPPTRRGMYLKNQKGIPDEVVAQIRRYPDEVKTEDIARKHDISISYTEMIRTYKVREDVNP